MEFERNAFEQRKRDHIAHALDSANQASGLSRLDRVHLIHEALNFAAQEHLSNPSNP